MLRFVILTHDHPFLHWDFLLESGERLRSWRLMQAPAYGVEIAAEPLADHRRLYLDYEGPVSGGRGAVRRWDWGHYELWEHAPQSLTIQLHGQRLHGTAHLQARGAHDAWMLLIRQSP
jgi:hypothetical protein